jgi:Transcriptional regulator
VPGLGVVARTLPGVGSTRTDGRSGRARRRDDTRAELLSIVERRLRSGETFADIKVGEIAAVADISRTTFYAYFEDKTELLRTWYSDVTDVILDAARTWWRLDGSASRSDLRDALAAIVAAYRPHPELMAATHEAVGYDHGVRDVVESSMGRYIDGLRAHIEHGQEAGFVDPALPAAETAYWLQWMAERGLHRMVRTATDEQVQRLLDAYTGIVWNTLYGPMRVHDAAIKARTSSGEIH